MIKALKDIENHSTLWKKLWRKEIENTPSTIGMENMGMYDEGE